MQGAACYFLPLAVIYALIGMAIGIYMVISQDHAQMPVHAHALVAGWLMSSVFAFFYHLFPKAGAGLLAQVHFWLTALSGIGLLTFLSWVLTGNQSLEPMVGVWSLLFYAAMLVFVVIALPAVYRKPA